MIKNIVSFSGGKDSTCLLLKMIEKGIQVDRVICVDTTKEFPQMYDHIQKVQAMIEPLKIEIVKIDFDYCFSEHIKTRGKIGEVGYGWPNFLNRWCTTLKIQAKRKLKNKDDVDFHGIAYDEIHRTLKNKTGEIFRYPLVDWKMTEKDCLEYCYSKGLDWGGLYEKFHRVSCWCCPLSRIGELKILYKEFPELWDGLKEMDKKSFRRFRSDYSVDQLEDKFKYCIY